MRPDSFWAKVLRASRPGRPLFTIKASPFWTEVLVAAGMQRGRTDDTMTATFDPATGDVRKQQPHEPVGAETEAVSYQTLVKLFMHPQEYSDLERVRERLRKGKAVVLDLTGMSDLDARHAVDFLPGLVLGLGGSMEKITNKVFILTPRDDSGVTAVERLVIAQFARSLRREIELMTEPGEPSKPEDEARAIEELLDRLHRGG